MTRNDVKTLITRALFNADHGPDAPRYATRTLFGLPEITYERAISGIRDGFYSSAVLDMYVERAERVLQYMEEANVVDLTP